jgi:hypothetical protein
MVSCVQPIDVPAAGSLPAPVSNTGGHGFETSYLRFSAGYFIWRCQYFDYVASNSNVFFLITHFICNMYQYIQQML